MNLAITDADHLDLNGYTADTVQAVRDALEKAKVVQSKEDATVSEMKIALQKLPFIRQLLFMISRQIKEKEGRYAKKTKLKIL